MSLSNDQPTGFRVGKKTIGSTRIAQPSDLHDSTNLASRDTYITETTPTSFYFNLTDVPTQFTRGYNSFKIAGSNLLTLGSEIYIEILDSNLQKIPWFTSKNYDRLGRRTITINVTETTAPGPCIITILGSAYDVPAKWNNLYNVKWVNTVTADPFKNNTSEIIFNTTPTLKVSSLNNYSTLNNSADFSNKHEYSASLHIYYESGSYQYDTLSSSLTYYNNSNHVYSNESDYKSLYGSKYVELISISGSKDNSIYEFYSNENIKQKSTSLELSARYGATYENIQYPIVATVEKIGDGVLSDIINKNLIDGYVRVPSPVNIFPETTLTGPYVSKIIDVLNSNTIALETPYILSSSNRADKYTIERFDPSEYELYWTTKLNYSSSLNQSSSYLKIELSNLSVLSGELSTIYTYFKSNSYRSEYQLISITPIKETNIFVSDTLNCGVDFGDFSNYNSTAEVSSSWSLIPNGLTLVATMCGVKYGYMYNWFALTNAAEITSSATWRVSTKTDWDTLIAYLGGASVAGGKLKTTRTEPADHPRFDSPNTGATNLYNFTGVPSGQRNNVVGQGFIGLGTGGVIWTATQQGVGYSYIVNLVAGLSSIEESFGLQIFGHAARTVRDATVLEQTYDDGTFCTPYTGNDGRKYNTVKIGTQVWLATNLAETKYRDGTFIPNITDKTAWEADTTGAYCAYDNDESNALLFASDVIYTDAIRSSIALNSTYLLNGITIQNYDTEATYYNIIPNNEISGSANNNYTFTFNAYHNSTTTGKLSIYLSGSSFYNEELIGEINSNNVKRYSNVSFNFMVPNTGTIYPIIKIESDNWYISNIRIYPTYNGCYNHFIYYIPTPHEYSNDLVDIKLEFFNTYGNKSINTIEYKNVKLDYSLFDSNIKLNKTYTGNLSAAATQQDVNDYIDTMSGSSGDVSGPTTSVDEEIVVFDGTTGKIIKGSGRTLITIPYSGSAQDTIADADTIPFWQMIGGIWKQTQFANFFTSILAKLGIGSTTHQVLHGGATPAFGPVVEADISLTNVATNDVTTARHGFVPILPNNATVYFDGQGNYTTPSGVVNSYKAQTFTAQLSASVVHNFGNYPAVQVTLADGYRMIPQDIKDDSLNQFTVYFAESTTGTILATIGSTQPQDVKLITTDYTVQLGDKILCCTNPVNITLLPVGTGTGLEYRIDNASTGDVMVYPSGSNTIEGESFQLVPVESAMNIYDNGNEYRFC